MMSTTSIAWDSVPTHTRYAAWFHASREINNARRSLQLYQDAAEEFERTHGAVNHSLWSLVYEITADLELYQVLQEAHDPERQAGSPPGPTWTDLSKIGRLRVLENLQSTQEQLHLDISEGRYLLTSPVGEDPETREALMGQLRDQLEIYEVAQALITFLREHLEDAQTPADSSDEAS